MPEYSAAKRISIFLSMRDEVDTHNILTHALNVIEPDTSGRKNGEIINKDDKTHFRGFLILFGLKKECFIPQYFTGGPIMKMVKLEDLEDYKNLPVTAWNIKQPANDDVRPDALETGGLDLILVPGMAFTKAGDRCGRGKGYYDTYLNKIYKEQEHPVVTVALAFREQILDFVPTDSHDFRVDHVISPDN